MDQSIPGLWYQKQNGKKKWAKVSLVYGTKNKMERKKKWTKVSPVVYSTKNKMEKKWAKVSRFMVPGELK